MSLKKANARLRRELNNISFAGLRGIKVGDALAIDIWNCFEWTKEHISNFEFAELSEYEYTKTGSEPDTVFLFTYAHLKRKDQLKKFCAVEKLFDEKIVIKAKKGNVRRNPYLGMIPIWYAQMHKLQYTSVIKLGICYQLCEATGHAKHLMKMLEEVKRINKLVVFFDVRGMDSILVQMCNQKNICTYTLQHGITNGTFDYVEYKCSHANYLLAWGEYTKKVAMRYGKPEESVKVVGNINGLLTDDFQKDANAAGCFVVCTNGVADKEQWQRNQELIEMANAVAKKYDMKYILKVHPFDNINRYNRMIDKTVCLKIFDKKADITKVFEKVEFTLCGNSTTFCDSIYWDVPAFRYITEAEKNVDVCKGISWGRFEDVDILENKLNEMKENRIQYMEQLTNVKCFLFCMEGLERQYPLQI